jgi:uncharacterized membrane protein/mono/diheme cytochrome c family protein
MWRLLLVLVGSLGLAFGVEAAGTVRADFADRFFRERVEPVFSTYCFECHGNGRHKGGLDLGSLDALLAGGDDGIVLVPGDSARSSLITGIRYAQQDEELNMPPKGKKLPPAVIADLTRWVDMGAPWPLSTPGTVAVPAPAAKTKPPLIGRLHPLVVHFPLACLLLALLAEALVLIRGQRWQPVTLFLVLIGTAGAIVAVITGGQLAQEETLAIERHELLGWITTVGAATCSGLLLLAKRWPLRLALVLTAILAGLTGHLGGTLVYGAGWFAF